LGGHTLLIRKSKPDWQKGKLNLVGGKIEPGERVEEAAQRELSEESMLVGDNFKIRGAVTGKKCHDPAFDAEGWIVWFLTCDIDVDILPVDQEGWDEPVQWHEIAEALSNPDLIPNLKLILPLMELKAPDWTVTETPSGLVFASYNWEMVPCMTSQ
jgi:8-oxo-dGTP pyrophosphatase MutT (NUDIX family)